MARKRKGKVKSTSKFTVSPDGKVQLTAGEKELLKELKKQLRKQPKKKRLKLLKIIIPVVVLVMIIAFIAAKCRKENTPLPEDKLTVCYLDVGQGDSIFLSAGGKNMLIDCGESEETDGVIRFLNEKSVEKLDYIVATHPHSDHMGGMYKIIDKFKVGQVIIPHLDDKDFPTTRYYEKFLDSCDSQDVALSEAKLGKIIELGDAQIEIIAPCSKNYENVNNYSVGLFLTHGENTFIFTGDAEALAEKEMADSGKLRHADVYKAGHHGSETSSCAEFMKAISPDYAVISCGEGNSYGHPNKKALKEISKYTDKIYRTDLNGTVTFVSDGKELKTNTEKE